MNIYHRDIKGENILLDSNFNVKLCDFGSSLEGSTPTDQAWLHRRLVPSLDHREVFGTLAYNAPEVLAGCDKRLYDKSDVFSLGCTLFLLVLALDQTFRQHPFKQARREDPLFRLLQSSDKSAFWQFFSKANASDDLRGRPESPDLLQRLLSRDPEERVSLQAIRQHPWMAAKGSKSEAQIVAELRDSFEEVASRFFESALEQLKQNDWKRFKGFTKRPSRPGSACDFSKEINEFIWANQAELARLSNKCKRPTSRQLLEDGDSLRLDSPSGTKVKCMSRPAEPYSVTKMLRQFSSSSSSNSSSGC